MKEVIYLAEIENMSNSLDDLEGFDLIQEEKVSFDSEKGFVDIEAIIQRQSDDKFFKVCYTNYGRGQKSLKEEVATEVQREQITTYIYK